jgi:hypothetical protein
VALFKVSVSSLSIDTYTFHVGAALQQEVPALTPRPPGQHSSPPSSQRRRLRILLLIGSCCPATWPSGFFWWSLEGRSFYILTDHKPLTFTNHRISDAWTDRQQRKMAYLAEYTANIKYVAGKKNVEADELSRPAAAIAAPAAVSVDFAEMSH